MFDLNVENGTVDISGEFDKRIYTTIAITTSIAIIRMGFEILPDFSFESAAFFVSALDFASLCFCFASFAGFACSSFSFLASFGFVFFSARTSPYHCGSYAGVHKLRIAIDIHYATIVRISCYSIQA
jgi:hypothetical protein